MKPYEILSFNNSFHCKGNSESGSPIHQNSIPFPSYLHSFSKFQSKDPLRAPHYSLFCLKLQLLQSTQLFDSSSLLSASALLLLHFKLFLKIRTHSLAFIHSSSQCNLVLKLCHIFQCKQCNFMWLIQNMDQPSSGHCLPLQSSQLHLVIHISKFWL